MTKPKSKDQLQKRGRKSLFREEYILIAKAAARFGAIEEEIADELNIGITTLERWKKYSPEFRGAIRASKAVADEKIEKALYQRAKGYSYRAEKVVVESLGNNRGSRARAVEYTEHMPPDTTAAIFFLRNRRPDRWRDVQRIDAAMGHYVLSDRPMTEEEWITRKDDRRRHRRYPTVSPEGHRHLVLPARRCGPVLRIRHWPHRQPTLRSYRAAVRASGSGVVIVLAAPAVGSPLSGATCRRSR